MRKNKRIKKNKKMATIDTILINDNIENDLLKYVETSINNKFRNNFNWVFSVDHFVPSNSVEKTKKHNRIKRLSLEVNGKIYYGQGIGQNILLEKSTLTGKLVLSNCKHISLLGAIGALGIPFEYANKNNIFETGYFDLSCFKLLNIELKGVLKEDVYIRDLILELIVYHKIKEKNVIIKFTGNFIKKMTYSDKTQLCNMAVEMGAVTAIIDYNYHNRNINGYNNCLTLIEQCECFINKKIDVSSIKAQIMNDNEQIIYLNNMNILSDLNVDQGFIGGCSLGMDEFRTASDLLKGRRIKDNVKLLISFPTNKMYIEAIKEGLIETYIDCGAILLNSGCGACYGGCQGKISKDQVMISTASATRKNLIEGKVYLGSTQSVIESCIETNINDRNIKI